MSQGPALEAHGVSKRYGAHDVLSGIDLVAYPGRLHGLLGPNGAGKTTLMRVLLGLAGHDAGKVRLFGRELCSMGGPIPEGVAGVVDAASFYPYLSGRQNLALLARLDGLRAPVRRVRIERAFDQVGLTAHADARVAVYSAGMRQRLGLAAALIRSPRLLFLDEPTSSLDPRAARDIRALARRLADAGAAVVLSSHDMAEVEELCGTLTVIDRGRVVFSGAVDELQMRTSCAVYALRTSDDRRALDVAARQRTLRVNPVATDGLEISADSDALDRYVVALGCEGVAVRALERRVRSLESLFLELTGANVAADASAGSLDTARDRRRASVAVL